MSFNIRRATLALIVAMLAWAVVLGGFNLLAASGAFAHVAWIDDLVP